MSKHVLFFTGLAASVLTALTWFLIIGVGKADIITYYLYRLQSVLFSGLLTLGGIYLFIRFFLVIQLKQSVFKNQKETNALRRFDRNLNLVAFTCFVSAIIQLVLGLIGHPVAIVISLFCAFYALSIAIMQLIEIHLTKSAWTDYLSV